MVLTALAATAGLCAIVFASSHREAPLISNDPLADNTDLYAFRCPEDTNSIAIIANFIPFELPEGGPNYSSFGENIRYEIHVDNNAAVSGDEITYRFTFTKMNEDPTTFFNIRLGKENLKTSYVCERSIDGGKTFQKIVAAGKVPPPNIGPRSIEGAAGLNKPYAQLVQEAITTASSGETVFCGPVDDPFFVDLGGVFDLGQTRKADGVGSEKSRDALAGFNCHTIALKIPIATLQKNGKPVSMAANILDGDYVIGVWASASRPKISTLRTDGQKPDVSGEWIQISRIGMPLTNEAVIPVGDKDRWNAGTPYETTRELSYGKYFVNPELALYMDDSKFGGAVPALADLRIQSKSLGTYDFRNGADGLYGLLATNGGAGTALDTSAFGKILLQPKSPRSVDLLPIFYTGVPNLPPYQLATGKSGNPLAAGKPFINNFLPVLGDMLRLNMATPVTPRESADFSSLGLVQCAALGLTDPRFNASAKLQWIPNMDGFPNGRRLEDDVTTIELQAVSGVVLAAIGLWYDDYTSGGSPVTPNLVKVLSYNAGPTKNDKSFSKKFPYMAEAHRGYDAGATTVGVRGQLNDDPLGFTAPSAFFIGSGAPNPFTSSTTLRFHSAEGGNATIRAFDARGVLVATIYDNAIAAGDQSVTWSAGSGLTNGAYMLVLDINGRQEASTRIILLR
ncbi:MAG: DUF4331 family protein [Candidatus Kapabacteria bacterium]|nr:DUF4331 family protein [Candidatus Kapabacteria bacterium]